MDIEVVALQLHYPGCVLTFGVTNGLQPYKRFCVRDDVEFETMQPVPETLNAFEHRAALVFE